MSNGIFKFVQINMKHLLYNRDAVTGQDILKLPIQEEKLPQKSDTDMITRQDRPIFTWIDDVKQKILHLLGIKINIQL